MTHFNILIRYEGNIEDAEGKIAELMAPYDENLEAPRYKKRMTMKRIKEAYEYYKVPNSNNATLTPEQFKEYFGDEVGKDKRGYFHWSTYNKKSKWDWYQVGGRWQGMLTLKAGALGRYVKQPNINNHNLPIEETLKRVKGKDSDKVDIAYLKDVDLTKMEELEIAGITEDYYKAMDWLLAELDKGKKFDDCINTLYFEYGIQNESLEERLARRSKFSTHAVLDKNDWHEWSEMGWFGSHHSEKEDETVWAQKFAERWLSNPTDKTIVAICDAHI